jgi:pimeloyl-ACP methyl ester carboxylesterase
MERSRHMDQNRERLTLRQRWSDAKASKTVVFWACVASAILTMIIGFSWGGWVTGGTARTTAENIAREAIVKRLAPICVVLAGRDPAKAVKLVALKDESTWQRGEYIGKQGWATMPGEQEPDRGVAEACATLLMPSS